MKSTCASCRKNYDNGTNGIHACDPADRIATLEAEVEKLREVAKAADALSERLWTTGRHSALCSILDGAILEWRELTRDPS